VDGLSRTTIAIASVVGRHRGVANVLDSRTLAQAPELSTITALDELLAIVVHALAAEHPTLLMDSEVRAHDGPPSLREARRLIRRVRSLRKTIARYRYAVLDAITPTRTTEEDLPF
jgi:hypothetical protein